MLQDIKPFKLYNEFKELHLLPPDENSLLVIRRGGELLIKEADAGESGDPASVHDAMFFLPKVTDCYPDAGNTESGADTSRPAKLTYLISVDGVRFYTPVSDAKAASADDPAVIEIIKKLLCGGFAFRSARELRYRKPAWLRYGALTAWQVTGWYINNRYCGRCGNMMQHSGKERAVICPVCGNTNYPKLCPVVIVGVIHDEKILLTKYAARGAYANYALVAGFAEIGETVEETVQREVMEETGLKVKNLRYYKSQPWAYSESLLFGFFCETEGEAAVTVDGEELSSAKWAEREAVPQYGDEISLTYEMMSQFRKGAEITRY